MSKPRGPSWRRVVAFGAIWGSVSAAALLAPGCYGRNCEGGLEVYGVEAGQGEMVDESTWASNAIDHSWLWFPRQRYYIFDVRALGGRTPEIVLPYISASPEPNKNGGNYTLGAGNLAEISSTMPNRVDVKNDTCSDYYLRLVVKVPPMAPTVPATDGGADGGIADAETEREAATDAGSDADGGL